MITADTILGVLKDHIENGRKIPHDKWIDAAFALNTLLLDEAEKLENMRLELAKYKIGILELQEKKNVSWAELAASATDLHKNTKVQEAKVEQIKEFTRIAKKNADNF